MTVSVENVLVSKVRTLLRDTDDGGILWGDAELISWLNEGCLEVARIRPASSSDTVIHQLVAGASQVIPAGAISLLEVICNTVNGAEDRVVRRVERVDLDNEMPNWRSSTASGTVMRYAPSNTDLTRFHVYPPSTGAAGHALLLVASVEPTVVTALSDNFPLESGYAAVVANYVLFRAFQKQLESPESQQRAGDYLQLFNTQMGVTDKVSESRLANFRQPTPS